MFKLFHWAKIHDPDVVRVGYPIKRFFWLNDMFILFGKICDDLFRRFEPPESTCTAAFTGCMFCVESRSFSVVFSIIAASFYN